MALGIVFGAEGHVFASDLAAIVTQVDNLTAPGWVPYTPVLSSTGTQPVLGTGSTAVGRYRLFTGGDLIEAEFKIVFGSSGTSAGTGFYHVSTPVAAHAGSIGLSLGAAYLIDAGVTTRSSVIIVQSATDFQIASPSGDVSATVPWTWGAGDSMQGSIKYQPV